MKKILIIVIELLVLSALAFTPAETIFSDNFEGYAIGGKFDQIYQVWEHGAVLNTTIDDQFSNSGDHSLAVEVISANPQNQSINGSLFRVLEMFQDDWSGANALRFWIHNPNEQPLLLSFNLKERYREYWAIDEEGVYYFQTSSGEIQQHSIQYNHLVIPADFKGTVILPFEFLIVPPWNTAKSNDVLELNAVESFAFSVVLGDTTPFTFYLDDIEVIRLESFPTLTVIGNENIEIPTFGEHLESFAAQLGSLDDPAEKTVDVEWTLQTPHDARISVDQDGILKVPHDSQGGTLTLLASVSLPNIKLVKSLQLTMSGGDGQAQNQVSDSTTRTGDAAKLSEFDQLSARFDIWAAQNRALFVALLLAGVMVFLSVLSIVERRFN